MTDPTDKLLLEAVYGWEQNFPDRVYMTQPTGGGEVVDFTWGETLDQARRMAAYLRSLELPQHSQIALISKNSAHFVMAELAIWMAGHVTVALYPTLNAESVGWILEHSESKMVIIGKLDGWDDMKGGIPDELPKVEMPLAPDTGFEKWDDIIKRFEPITDNPSPTGDQLCLICYTSGSTGRPKGVMHSFSSASIPAQHFGDGLCVTENDRVLSYLPLAHVMERVTVEFVSFYTGMHIYFSDKLSTFVADMQRARPTLFISVPRLWLKFQMGVLQKFPQKKLDRLLKIPIVGNMVKKKVREGLNLGDARMVGSGSAPLPASLIEWYDKIGLHIVEGYGMSEDFAYSHMSTLEKRKPGYVGIAWPNVETRISEAGEIQIKSPGDMVGYFKQPELTAECYTEDGFFRTGDRGEYLPNGLLRITGRSKELFKTSKGKYVAPVPIENLLNSDDHLELSCVSGVGRPACYAVVQLGEDMFKKFSNQSFRDEVNPKLEALLGSVNGQIEEFEKVQFLAVVKTEWQTGNDFLTPTLKIKRNVIEETYAPYLDEWYDGGQKIIWQD